MSATRRTASPSTTITCSGTSGPSATRASETVMILLSATDLGRQFAGDPVFNGLKFDVRAGERIGLVGPNGVGKTTLMRLLARADQPDYGDLYVRPGIKVSLLK